jgi:hypothetical protein
VSEHAEVLATFDALYAAACEARDGDAMFALFVTDDDVSLRRWLWHTHHGSEPVADLESP